MLCDCLRFRISKKSSRNISLLLMIFRGSWISLWTLSVALSSKEFNNVSVLHKTVEPHSALFHRMQLHLLVVLLLKVEALVVWGSLLVVEESLVELNQEELECLEQHLQTKVSSGGCIFLIYSTSRSGHNKDIINVMLKNTN